MELRVGQRFVGTKSNAQFEIRDIYKSKYTGEKYLTVKCKSADEVKWRLCETSYDMFVHLLIKEVERFEK